MNSDCSEEFFYVLVSTVLAQWILDSDEVCVIQVLQAAHNYCRGSVTVPGDVTV